MNMLSHTQFAEPHALGAPNHDPSDSSHSGEVPYATVLETFELLCMVQDLARSLRKRWNRQLRMSIPDMNALRATVILQLGHIGAASQRRLARLLGISQMSVSRLLDDLEDRGWVRREAVPGDRRPWAIHLTGEGHQMLGAIQGVRRMFVERVCGALDESGRAAFMATLLRLEAAPLPDSPFDEPASTRRIA